MPSDQEAQRPVFFELPGSPIKGIPLMNENERLAVGLVEVGCRYEHKPKQLKDKRELFMRHWAENYRKRGIEWTAHFYRMGCYYRPWPQPNVQWGKSAVDAAVYYTKITEQMLQCFTPEECKHVAEVFPKKRRDGICRLLEEFDAERLQWLIIHDRDCHHSTLRGRIAEVLAQCDVQKALPPGMSLYRNGDVRYFSRKFREGTEIDGITTCYGEAPYRQLVENLRGFDHLVVHDRWHPK